MSSIQLVAATAFRLHEEGRISQEELMCVVKRCLNATALDNGYANTHGMPFPEVGTLGTLKIRSQR